MKISLRHPLVPAKAGIQPLRRTFWIPAFAGMSGRLLRLYCNTL
jgi:hypothetical protein